jgi:hypothetical protein
LELCLHLHSAWIAGTHEQGADPSRGDSSGVQSIDGADLYQATQLQGATFQATERQVGFQFDEDQLRDDAMSQPAQQTQPASHVKDPDTLLQVAQLQGRASFDSYREQENAPFPATQVQRDATIVESPEQLPLDACQTEASQSGSQPTGPTPSDAAKSPQPFKASESKPAACADTTAEDATANAATDAAACHMTKSVSHSGNEINLCDTDEDESADESSGKASIVDLTPLDGLCVSQSDSSGLQVRILVCPSPGLWFGLVWFGLVWFGLGWFGLVWFGLGRL